MAQHSDRAAGHHSQCLHVHGEGVDLHPVDLIAGEGAGQRVDADVFGFDVARGLVELAIQAGYFDFAGFAARGAERGVLAEQTEHMQSAGG